MSAMDFKKNTDLDFPRYATPAVSTKEIDLLGLLDVLLAAKKRIVTIVLAFAVVGLAIAFLIPQTPPAPDTFPSSKFQLFCVRTGQEGPLFSDAESSEYLAQKIIGRKISGNCAE